MARSKGTASFSANFEPQKAAPLDARFITANKADLILTATWTGRVHQHSMVAHLCKPWTAPLRGTVQAVLWPLAEGMSCLTSDATWPTSAMVFSITIFLEILGLASSTGI